MNEYQENEETPTVPENHTGEAPTADPTLSSESPPASPPDSTPTTEEAEPTAPRPGSRESIDRYYEKPSVYLDVATYCSVTLPRDLGWSTDVIIHMIDCASNPNMKCRMFLQIAKFWKDMATRTNAKGRRALINFLFRLHGAGDEKACLLLAYLRRCPEVLHPSSYRSKSATEFPYWVDGPADDDRGDHSVRWKEPALGDLMKRCEEIAAIDDFYYELWLGPEAYCNDIHYEYSGTSEDQGYKLDSDFWEEPTDNLHHL